MLISGFKEIRSIATRSLRRDEVAQVWTIDRSEEIHNIYYLENGNLVLKPEHYDMHGWPPGEAEKYTPHLLDCFDRGGWFLGLFDQARLIGAAILESRFIGRDEDQLQLTFLHVSHAYRGTGWGRRLFEMARMEARSRGARRLYISATPSENTVDFYLHLGCRLVEAPDPELFEREPEDIHLECEA